MINKDRIVPATKADLLSLYGTMLNSFMVMQGGGAVPSLMPVIPATSIDGEYDYTEETEVSGICDQPVKSFKIGAEADASIFFIPDYTFEGIFVGETRVDVEGDIDASSSNFYVVSIEEGNAVVNCITPLPAE